MKWWYFEVSYFLIHYLKWIGNKMKRKQTIIVGMIFFFFLINIFVTLAQPDLEVEGIVYEENGQSYAIVNGKIIEVGDKVDESEVIEINKDFIKFKYGNELFVKAISEELVKQEDKDAALEQYKSRMNAVKGFVEEQKEEQQKLMEIKKLNDLKEKQQYLEYAEKSDEYYEAAMRYELSKNYQKAFEALQKSVNNGEQSLRMPMDDASRTNIDSIIKYRKKELKRIKAKCYN